MEQKELNQTITNEAKENQEAKKNDSGIDIAEIRQKIEKRYDDKLTKAQQEFTAQLQAANQELEFYKNQLPELEKAFIKNGGNKDYFNDWLQLNKSKVEYDKLDDFIKASFEVSKWAKSTESFNVNKVLNNGAKETRYLDLDDLYPGTVYRKMK